jgi:MoxR-like ATPase
MENNIVLQNIISNVEKVMVGKRGTIEKIIICLISGGHVLIEDVPGVGKTVLVHSIAKSINCDFKRIQFTPDLLPSDITGVSIYNQKTGEFEFKKGPIMGQIILADEINRTSPKTQASLLEAMEEHQITVDGITYKLKEPFMVLATQNPMEYEGTFPLPEAQLDRFMMKVNIGYPDETSELNMLKRFKEINPLTELKPVANTEDIIRIKNEVKSVMVNSEVEMYILSIVRSTRENDKILLGASPRASLNLYRASQGRAILKGRDFVTPDDVKYVSKSVLSHRIIVKPEYRLKGLSVEDVINEILKSIKVPGVSYYD